MSRVEPEFTRDHVHQRVREHRLPHSVVENSFVSTTDLKPGDRLPAETAMVRAMPFSLGTVQRALGKLVEDGVVERRRLMPDRVLATVPASVRLPGSY